MVGNRNAFDSGESRQSSYSSRSSKIENHVLVEFLNEIKLIIG